MLLNNNKMVLIYGFNDEEINLLNKIIKSNSDAVIKNINKSMLNMKIKDIINGFVIKTYTQNPSQEKVILFNSFSDEELENTILNIKGQKSFNPILAVVTPTSSEWTFNELLKHLLKEREWFKKSIHKNM